MKKKNFIYDQDQEFPEGFDLSEFLEDLGADFKVNSSDQMIFDECPYCSRSKKFYMDRKTGQFICFVCNEKGGPIWGAIKIVSHLASVSFKKAAKMIFGNNYGEVMASISSVEEGDEDFLLLKKKRKRGESVAPGEVDLPPEMKPLEKARDKKAWNYLSPIF